MTVPRHPSAPLARTAGYTARAPNRHPRPRRRSRAVANFSITPLIDMVFLLILFFLMTYQFSSSEFQQVELPRPHDSQAELRQLPQKVTVNIVYDGPDRPVRYVAGAIDVATVEELAERLARRRARTPDLQVVVRADRRIDYGTVRACLEAISGAGIDIVNVAARMD